MVTWTNVHLHIYVNVSPRVKVPNDVFVCLIQSKENTNFISPDWFSTYRILSLP